MSLKKNIALLLVAGAAGLGAPAQQAAGCTLQFQDHYRCDREGFQSELARARTVSISVARMELFAGKELRKLVAELGKVEAPPGTRPDLVFELSAIDRSGRIDFGPNDFALATLSVYQPARGTEKRKLLWVETFDGQEDRPWPGTVVDLIHNFQRDALSE